ncbi:MAG: hypothetical protein HYU31_10050 [Deltaproteobacteria bacterium]|nr:hypothetical protein [Deltaproteobacteria bacterium]
MVAALNLRYGIKERLARELRSYGANLVLVPRTEPFLKERDLVILEDKRLKDRIIGYAPFIHRVAKVDGKEIVLVGARFSQLSKISQWWQVEGRWPEKDDEALIGTNAASKLGLRLGDRFSAVHKISQLSLSVTGLLRTFAKSLAAGGGKNFASGGSRRRGPSCAPRNISHFGKPPYSNCRGTERLRDDVHGGPRAEG